METQFSSVAVNNKSDTFKSSQTRTSAILPSCVEI